MTKDMTTGSPVRLITGFAVPMFLGMLFQQIGRASCRERV